MHDTFPGPLRVWRDRGILLLFAFLLLIYPVSAVVVALHLVHGSWNWIASVVIALHAALVLLGECRSRDWGTALVLAGIIGAAAIAVEHVGSTTGFPFGPYWYTDDLRMPLFGVPVVMAAAWITVTFTTFRIAEHLIPAGAIRAPRIALLAALLTVLFDVVLEPSAAFVSGYWVWSEGVVPLRNYFAWFVLSFLFVLMIALVRSRRDKPVGIRRIAYAVFLMQWSMFAFTSLIHGYFLETGLSVTAVVSLAAFRKPWRTGTSMEVRA